MYKTFEGISAYNVAANTKQILAVKSESAVMRFHLLFFILQASIYSKRYSQNSIFIAFTRNTESNWDNCKASLDEEF